MKIGLPLMVGGLLHTLMISVDRLFLIKVASPHELGIYQFGALPLTFGIALNGILNQYLSPKLLSEYGRDKSIRDVFRKSLQVSLVLLIVSFVGWPIVMKVVAVSVRQWLPEYESSVPIISIFYLGMVFLASNFVSITVNAANRQVLYLLSSIVITVPCFIGYLVVAKYAKGIEWYAYVNVAGIIASFLLILVISFYCSREDKTQVTAGIV